MLGQILPCRLALPKQPLSFRLPDLYYEVVYIVISGLYSEIFYKRYYRSVALAWNWVGLIMEYAEVNFFEVRQRTLIW